MEGSPLTVPRRRVLVRDRIIALGCVVAAASGCAFSQQPSQPLTLQDCVRLAEGAPSPVTLARQERDIAALETTQARAGFLPQSRLATGFTYNSPLRDDHSTVSFIPLNAVREYAALLTVTQEFDTSGRLRAELSRARANRDAASVGFSISRRDLRRAVSTAFYRLLLTRRIAQTLTDALAESRTFERRTQLLFEGGEAAQADVVKAGAQAAFVEQNLKAAQLEATLANQELAAFWTRDVEIPLALTEVLDQPLPPPEGPAAEPAPFMRRLEFTLLDAQLRGFQADYRRARSALLPQLGLIFQYGIDAPAVRIRDRGYAAFVNLNIPIFDWMKARSQMKQFELRTQQVETNRAIAGRLFSRDYQSALVRVQQLYEQISLTDRQARLAADDLRLSRVRYEGGEGLALDVVTAQSQLAQARANYYTAVANYLNARADLEVASGR